MTSVFWLPPFHDMGLIGGLLSPLFVGAHSVILSPNSFLSRPLRWLQTISEYRAIVTGAPNFAYQLCVDRIDGSQCDGLKLDCLKVAFCGAEPIQGQTLEHFTSRFSHTGFKRSAMFPCYGLAESTLYVSGGHLETNSILTLDRKQFSSGSVQPVDARTTHSELTARVVSCGTPARGTEILIVDPKTHTPLAEDLIGEIWIRGCSVAKGYWETQAQVSPQATASATSADESSSLQASFRRTMNGQPTNSPAFLHTGDLGFFHNGQLFITGRSKDVIILRGRNHYPQDIEFSISKDCENDLLMIAAVMCTSHGGEELAIVAEMGRTTDKEKIPELIRTVRRAVIEDHDVDPVRVVLVRPASLPRTTSGKLQRSAVREMLEQGTLSIRGQWDRSNVRTDGAPLIFPQLSIADGENAVETIATKIETWMLSWLVIRVGVSKDEVSPERSLDELGLDSLTAVELSGEIEDWLGLQLTPMVAYEHPTPSALSSHLANEWVKKQPQKSIGSS
jgi:acyl-CoA synthetase (AMP-forming)/AMP-acid ligase II/acyl carrier protein